MQRRALWRALAGLAALAIAAIAAGPAGAHAKLLGSAPGDGATVIDPLAAVILEFNEAVGAPELTVASPDGQPLAIGPAEARDRNVIQPLPPLPQQGVYSVTYRVISADKDPVTGQLAFTYQGPVPQAQATPSAATADAGPGAGQPPAGGGQAAGAMGGQAAAAEPAAGARPSWPIWIVAAVVLLGVTGAAWYALTRKPGVGS